MNMYAVTPATLDLFKSIRDVDKFVDVLVTKEKLRVVRREVINKKYLHITGGKISENSTLQEECSLIVLDEEGNLVVKGPDVLAYSGNSSSRIRTISSKRPAAVEEWLNGTLVTITKNGNTYFITTKEDLFGKNKIVTYGPSCSDIVLNYFDRIGSHKGIDILFENEANAKYSWCFVIVPKDDLFPNRTPNAYELFLINKINLINCCESDSAELDEDAKLFGLSRPKKVVIESYRDVPLAIKDLFLRNDNIRGGIVASSSWHSREKMELDLEELPFRDRLACITAAALKDNSQFLDSLPEKYTKITDLIQTATVSIELRAIELLKRYDYCDTVKELALTLATNTDGHELKPVALAFFKNKTDKLGSVYGGVHAAKALKIFEQYFENSFKQVITNLKTKLEGKRNNE